jgi:hypothetical protein
MRHASSGEQPAFWPFAFLAIVVAYLLPTLIGMIRRVDRLALVFLANLIGAANGCRLASRDDPGVRAENGS